MRVLDNLCTSANKTVGIVDRWNWRVCNLCCLILKVFQTRHLTNRKRWKW